MTRVGDVVGPHLVHAQGLELLPDGVGQREDARRPQVGRALDDEEQDRRRQGQREGRGGVPEVVAGLRRLRCGHACAS